MKVLVKIQTIRLNDEKEEVLDEQFIVGDTIGACLDYLAPDSMEGIIFRVIVISKEVDSA